jgi:uncharacterized protein
VANKFERNFVNDSIFFWLLFTPIIFWLVMYLDNFSVSRLDAETAIQVLIILPVIEEVIFRGLIQPWLANRYNQKKMGITQANLITSCLFVLVHLYQHNLIMALYTFLPSLIFGYTRDRYKRLIPSIILHSSYNGGYFLIGSQLINY